MFNFIWARNRNANGRGSDPMPQLIHQDVGCAHLEIVASVPVIDASHQSTADVLNKAAWLSYFTTTTVGLARKVREAMEESKDAAHH
jgi:hypothetical protein